MKKILALLIVFLFGCDENNPVYENGIASEFALTNLQGEETSLFKSGEEFYVEYSVTNQTGEDIDFIYSGALIYTQILQDGEIVMSSTDGVSFPAVIETATFEAGEEVTYKWKAPISEYLTQYRSLAPGNYTIKVISWIPSEDEEIRTGNITVEPAEVPGKKVEAKIELQNSSLEPDNSFRTGETFYMKFKLTNHSGETITYKHPDPTFEFIITKDGEKVVGELDGLRRCGTEMEKEFENGDILINNWLAPQNPATNEIFNLEPGNYKAEIIYYINNSSIAIPLPQPVEFEITE